MEESFGARTTEIFYLTDKGFAVPTIASIYSLRQWSSATPLKVNVILLGMNAEEVEAFSLRIRDLRVQVHTLSNDDLDFFDKTLFHKTHVPYTTLARFLIPRFVSGGSDIDILYIDGDTWFLQDPKPLLDFPMPPTGLLASEDQSYFYRNDFGPTGKEVTSYFANLGIAERTGYFNAGVIKCRANEWAMVCSDCLAYLEQNLALCRYHDQSALNAAAGKKRMRLSPVWNFQTPYWSWGASEIAAPKLLHFVGGGKPWMGALRPWSTIYTDYMEAIRDRAHPLFPLRTWDQREQAQEAKQEAWSDFKNKTFFKYRIRRRLELFQHLVDTAVL